MVFLFTVPNSLVLLKRLNAQQLINPMEELHLGNYLELD
jgi:hypothetical protein